MTEHYDLPTLEAYARGGLDAPAKRGVEEHITECSSCRDFVLDEQVLGRYLRDARMWEVADVVGAEAAPAGLSRVLAAAERVAREDREARALLERALAWPEAFRKAEVGTQPAYETKGVVRHLCASAKAVRDSNPKFARRIAAEAARIASRAQWPLLRADALTELGCVLIRLGRFSKAEEVLVAAERSLDAVGQTDLYARALVWYSRAMIAREQRRFDQALELSQKAAAVFQDVDPRMLSVTMFVTGNVLFAKNQFAEAVAMMEDLLASGCVDADHALRAMALHNAGATYLRTGQDEAARLRLSEAAAIFEQLGQATWIAKNEWLLALSLTKSGAYDEAAEALERAHAELDRLGLPHEAALAALELAEALLLTGENRRAAEVCKKVVFVLDGPEMQHEANRALAYIREATERGTATPSKVREVRLFLQDLPNHSVM